MSKGNLFLGQGRGKVGDVVFYRSNGQQITRSRNRSPKNPRSPMQLAQRVIMNTVSKAYALLAPIADHSWEGLAEGSPCQRRFLRDNVDLLRLKSAAVFADPEAWRGPASEVFNYCQRSSVGAAINEYYISRGTIASTTTVSLDPAPVLVLPGTIADISTMTYQQLVDALGVQRGDQLTFVVCTHDGRFGANYRSEYLGLMFARVILEPASGVMTIPFMNNGVVNDPNPKNEGEVILTPGAYTIDGNSINGIKYEFNGVSLNPTADINYGGAAVIVSRWSGDTWQRSTQQLVPLFQGMYAEQWYTLDLAIESYMSGEDSALYLNQSDSSGSDVGADAVVELVSYNADIVPQGSQITSASTSRALQVYGYNLSNDNCVLTVDGVVTPMTPHSGSLSLTLSTAGEYVLTVNGRVWCEITINA